MRKKNFILINLLLLFVLSDFSKNIQDDIFDYKGGMNHEYELKLAFIKQFPLFIEWPKDKDNIKNNDFVIGIYGTNNFKEFIKDLEYRVINNKPVKVIEVTSYSKIKDLDILFISHGSKKQITDLITICQKNKVLSISDRMGMIEKGIMINFFIENNNIRFELNKTILDNQHFKVSSRLWRMGKIIE